MPTKKTAFKVDYQVLGCVLHPALEPESSPVSWDFEDPWDNNQPCGGAEVATVKCLGSLLSVSWGLTHGAPLRSGGNSILITENQEAGPTPM